jgi:hypothetical protein
MPGNTLRYVREKLVKTSVGQIQVMNKIMGTLDIIGIKLFFVGCTERTLVVSVVHYSFVCLRYVVSVAMHYRMCLVTAGMKVLQNVTLVRYSKRADCWCAFNWSMYNLNGHFIGCIQSSSVRGYGRVHKS